MNRLLLIFILLITFNANSIAGSVMMSSMGNMDMSMSQDCHGDMSADMEMMGHCDDNKAQNQACDEINCAACVSHCSSAVIADISSPIALDPPLQEFHYLLAEALSVNTRMLRPPKTV